NHSPKVNPKRPAITVQLITRPSTRTAVSLCFTASGVGDVSFLRTDMANTDGLRRAELHYAASQGDVELTRLLLASGGDPNARDCQVWTPLHFAAQASSAPVVELLLAAGANPELRDSHGNTPLFRAVFSSKGNGDVIILLRANGADPLAENSSGVSP